MGKRKGPLNGIRLVDLTQLYPGPLATMMLADLGADVVRIEHPSRLDILHRLPPFIGEESAAYLSLNRSKRSLGLDTGKAEGQQVFFDLIRTADVVVEQFRPGVLDKIGIGYEQAVPFNPRIIYVSITGFGQDGPYRQRAGHDINYISLAGLLSHVKREDSMVLPGFQTADVVGGGYMSVVACMAALWNREKTGKGQRVDVSMTDSIMPMLTLQLAQYWGSPGTDETVNLFDGTFPFYGVYECADGKHVSLGALEQKFWTGFCQMVGKPEWLPLQFSMGDEKRRVRDEIAALFKTRSRDEWLKLAEVHDICLSSINEMKDLEKDPQLQTRQMIIETEHEGGRKLKGVGIPIKFSGSKPDYPEPAPAVGQHSIDILQEIGYMEERIQELIGKGIVFAAVKQ
ncbi:MAG: CoA transferase [Deltaproteobacteria bacterium]|nr:CoA transferase [Deltaproteobacteria bacterium]